MNQKIDINWKALENLNGTDTRILLRNLQPRLNKYMIHKPMPKQAVFMNLKCKEAFYGGAAGGGKSDCLLMDALQYVDVKGYSAVIFRKSYADLVKPGALIDRSKEWLLQFPEIHWNEKEKKFEWLEFFSRGRKEVISTLQFGYMESENDKYNYQGGEYQYAGFDELTHFSESNYKYIFSRLRRLTGSKIPLKIRSASNPPDEGQGMWVYDRFVNPKTKKKDVIFLPSGLDDNPFIDTESYDQMLNELDPVTRARLRDGNWEIVRKGNMFKRDWYEVVESPPPYRRKCRFWDLASTDDKIQKSKSKDPDYTVGALMSESRGVFYIEDIVRVRKRPQETEDLQYITAVNDGYNVMVREEQEPGSSGEYTITTKAKGIFKGKNYKGIRSTGSKVERANAFSAASERGQVKIVKGCRFVDEFFHEAEIFPAKGSGVHDDIIDALSGAFKELGTTPGDNVPWALDAARGSYWNEISTEDSSYFVSWRDI